MSDLSARIKEIARAPVLLVASDYDGTLAPIVSQPANAHPIRESMIALRAIAAMPNTHVAIISGRALDDLAFHTGDAAGLRLVGSHGSEFDPGFAASLSPRASQLRATLGLALRDIAARHAGSWLEEKPAALAFHYRNAAEATANAAVAAVMDGPAKWPGVFVRSGKKVIELSVVETNKGDALRRIRSGVGATAAIYIGDDETDEDAFSQLSGPDLAIRVGNPPTRAEFQVADQLAVSRLLAQIAELRADWLAGSEAIPIEQLSLLSDQRAVAMVAPNGRIVWGCFPRIDSPALFAELLGGPTAGYFEITPATGVHRPKQNYCRDTFVLETHWPTFRVWDYFDCSDGRAFQRAGRSELIRVIHGRGRAVITFAPRLDFGRTHTRLRVEAGAIEIVGATDPIVLVAPALPWQLRDEGPHQTAWCEVELDEAPLVLELRYGTASIALASLPEAQRRSQTERFWRGWAETLRIPSVAPDLVCRSALVLKALVYGPSGAIAAAATTSLPEHAGGVRNWDYRFCWPRDAALSAAALVRLGNTGQAMKFLDWTLAVLDRLPDPHRLRPVYAVDGHDLGPEAEIGGLSGYRGSRPIRVGNAAAQQVQLDVFGPIAELIALLAARGAPLSSEHWRLTEHMVNAVAHRWQEPDHGIWEPRKPASHHVHSKVMCWLTVDRGIAIAAYCGRKRPEWSALRDQIALDVLERGWKPGLGGFSSAYDSNEPDAASLWVGLSGLLPPTDSRFVGTVEVVERTLRKGPTVLRYRYDDGLPGSEGGFNLCTSWLIEAYAMIGRRADAEKLFDEYCNLAGPTGLISEEYDPVQRRALGNHPQAYSHLGLINAAVRLAS